MKTQWRNSTFSSIQLRPIRIALWLAVIWRPLCPLPGVAETFDVRVRAFCHNLNCDKDNKMTYDEFRNIVLNNFNYLNAQWIRTGFSFRPKGGDLTHFFTITQENIYSHVSDPSDPAISDLKTMAKKDPNVITVFLLEDLNGCFSGVNYSDFKDDNRAVFCFPGAEGVRWGHELGHYFCLPHTFSFQDPADNNPVNHDEDKFCCTPNFPGVRDTPPDPGRFEYSQSGSAKCPSSNPGCDGSSPHAPLDGHVWCEPSLATDVDPGSTEPPVFAQGVYNKSVDCQSHSNGHTTDAGTYDLGHNAMTYYYWGPYIKGGYRYDAFTWGQIAQIHWCRAHVPERAKLVNVCARSGDTDHDGICDADDACPEDADTTSKDSDHDGLPDVCDLCPNDPTPELTDTDGDGRGDLCDPDDDNDGCCDDATGGAGCEGVDQHPKEASVPIGTRFNIDCAKATSTAYGFEGSDPDGDGLLSCRDPDDDNDGIMDDDDPCPFTKDDTCNFPGVPCPPAMPACFGQGCERFYLKILLLEDSDWTFRLDIFRLDNRRVYVFPAKGRTVSETAMLFVNPSPAQTFTQPGERTTVAAGARGRRTVRVEIWSRRSNEFVALFAEYDAEAAHLGEIGPGHVVVLNLPSREGDPPVSVAASWAVGAEAGTVIEDGDADRVPGPIDNCPSVFNPLQVDADADGVGNACDADLDNDGIVTEADVDAVRACDGADLDLWVPPSEPGFEVELPERDAILKRLTCSAADLNEDRRVDGRDVDVAERALGTVGAAWSFHLGLADPRGQLATAFDDGLAVTLDLERPIRPRLSWDLRFGFTSFDGRGASADLDVWDLSANLKYDFQTSGPWRPFVNAGLGLYLLDPGGLEGGYNAGFGVGYLLHPRTRLELAFSHHATFTASPDVRYTKLQLGVVRRF